MSPKNTLPYKGYLGEFWYDPEIDMFDGEVVGTRDMVTFRGRSVDELRQALHESVDQYLDFCAEVGKEPDKPYSGRFNVRLSPEVHQGIALAAKRDGLSLNAWVAETLAREARKDRP
jgi:predicted HicB family RNase H-like nuclease